jgi:hypothetical protein
MALTPRFAFGVLPSWGKKRLVVSTENYGDPGYKCDYRSRKMKTGYLL